jgi:arginine decarboxylase
MTVVVGNRIPRDYFVTQGRGESDVTIHAGSYHLALREAGIEMANIMGYSSILPAIATEVHRPLTFTHGEVMETIMAVATCEKGQTATAGLIYGWLFDIDGNRYGGLVCEYNGPMHPLGVSDHLRDMLDELHQNGYEKYRLDEISIHTETVTPIKKYGTALVGICFVNYEVPVYS